LRLRRRLPGSQWLRHEIALAKPPQFHIINKVILIDRLGQNAEAKNRSKQE
jgi:hypothetical protein